MDIDVGKLTLEYGDQTIDLGDVQLSESVMKRASVTPVVSKPANNGFPIETGNSHSYSISFQRVNPVDPDDSSSDTRKWSNKVWYEHLTSFVDRWQMKTNGCRLVYTPGEDEPYMPRFEVGGYIKTLTRTYNNKFNELITGSIQFTVGTMHVNSRSPPKDMPTQDVDEMEVLISDATGTQWYVIFASNSFVDIDCITSIDLYGGPNQFVEYARIVLPKKKLYERVPDLMIKDGQTQIYLNMFGSRRMTVVESKTSSTEFTLVAYADAFRYNSAVLPQDIEGQPLGIIQNILGDSSYGVEYPKSKLVYLFDNDVQTDDTTLKFKAGTSARYVLNVCATYIGCLLYFCDGYAYLVDYSKPISTSAHSGSTLPEPYMDAGKLKIVDTKMLVGSVTVDEDGINSACNKCYVTCGTPQGAESGGRAESSSGNLSVDVNGVLNKKELNIPELLEGTVGTGDDRIEYMQGTTFADNYVRYSAIPRRDFKFKFKELYRTSGTGGGTWSPYFGSSARATVLYDEESGEHVDNMDYDGTHANGSLILSSYVRQYPGFTTTYRFGSSKSIDLQNYIQGAGGL